MIIPTFFCIGCLVWLGLYEIRKWFELLVSIPSDSEHDEKESGLRKILNYGHTYGHALEKLTNYKKYTHGETVIEGILFALKLAHNLNLIDKEYKFLCEDLIKKYKYDPLLKFEKEKVVDAMLTDKKATENHIKFILPTKYATVEEYDFTPDELKEMIYS